MPLSPLLPDLSHRARSEEWMDDPNVDGAALKTALEDLRGINRLLGGLRATNTILDPLLQNQDRPQILDVGSGTGDYLAHLVTRGDRFGAELQATGVDLNPETVEYGRSWLDDTLSPALRKRTRLEVADALQLPYADDAFDATHAALFLHHFHGPEAVQLLQEMDRVSRFGIVVNDLHRHLLAWAGIWILSRVLRMSLMVQHDGPLSVRRGFRKTDLRTLADRAGLADPRIHWHWAFRWTLSTVSSGAPITDS